jgi:hypothetical protein
MSASPVTTEEFAAHIARTQAIVSAKRNNYSVGFTVGPRYFRVFTTLTTSATGGRDAHHFVDRATGDILKADSWKAPSPIVRGNIRQDNLEAAITCYGARYAR